MMTNVALPVITLVIGALLGLASSLLAIFITHRRTIELRLLDQFLLVRKELVDAVSVLSNMSSRDEFRQDRLAVQIGIIAKLYFEHFDFLPGPVTDSLLLLHAALRNPARGPYSIEKGMVTTLDDSHVLSFITQCSRFENTK